MAAAVLPALGVSASTAATISTVLSVVSAVGGFVSTLSQGKAAQAAANYNAAVARQNAQIARDQAAAEEKQHRLAAKARSGAARAAAGGSGLTLEGSALDILESNATQEELSALNIRYGGELQARGFENEARLQKLKAKQAPGLGSALLTAGGSLLGDLKLTG